MTKVKVELEFDEQVLGEGWMNPDNLDLLLFSPQFTERKFLQVTDYLMQKRVEIKN